MSLTFRPAVAILIMTVIAALAPSESTAASNETTTAAATTTAVPSTTKAEANLIHPFVEAQKAGAEFVEAICGGIINAMESLFPQNWGTKK